MEEESVTINGIVFNREMLDELLLDIIDLYNLRYNIIIFDNIDEYAKHILKVNVKGFRDYGRGRYIDTLLLSQVATKITILNRKYKVM